MRRDWFSQDQQETKDPKKLGSHLSNTEIKKLMRITLRKNLLYPAYKSPERLHHIPFEAKTKTGLIPVGVTGWE